MKISNRFEIAISECSAKENYTGRWRSVKPVYSISKIAPCSMACPIGTDIPSVLNLIKSGRFEEGWRLLKSYNPLPGVCGRICSHPCTERCNKNGYNSEIFIPKLERFLADYGRINNYTLDIPPLGNKGKGIAIVGSGPAGISCAYFLRSKGYEVTIFEATNDLGGILRWGIPDYRLQKAFLEYEIKTVIDNGVRIKIGISISRDISIKRLLSDYDAVFVSIGAHKSSELKINEDIWRGGSNNNKVISGLEFLKDINRHKIDKNKIGKEVAVIGGGNTAIDVARSLLRLNSQPLIIYRKSKDAMPAIINEVEEAVKEGVKIFFNTLPIRFIDNGDSMAIECMQTYQKTGDDLSRTKDITLIENSNFFIEVNNIITAVGQEPDLLSLMGDSGDSISLLDNKLIGVDSNYHTSIKGLFAGGDVITRNRTVANAIAGGKNAALSIDNFLTNTNNNAGTTTTHIASIDKLNLYYLSCDEKTIFPYLPVERRLSGFKEIDLPIDKELAIKEASRCWSCGKCISCDNCILYCPDLAVSKDEISNRYNINYDYCKGCGICAEECPVSAILINKEEK